MDLPAVVLSYLLGSISFPWLIAWWHGIDLRAVGARKLGGSDLGRALGPRWGATGGLLDAAKGVAPVIVARAAGLPAEIVVLCAVAAVVGQMWPIFHDLDGGRGNATGWGSLIALDLPASIPAAILLGAAAAARRFAPRRPTRLVPLASLLAFCAWSAALFASEGLSPRVVGGVALAVLIVVRRLTARLGEDLATGDPLWRILLDRALFDRTALQARGAVPI